ncbi:hypothetical protein [Psychrobacter sp. SWN149]|uniref:hypothetical protein n=1 Tax=Psychrobacter sp. SWN149 TaxID=2792057 RepID=UPI0018CD988F|nr:hypothetical protein [Psychrobacter sp. SWN149]MBH0005229.1 hypothetical protein [Psychrobacter sp. SWN149]
MTEPTAKPSTEANRHQGTTATAKKESKPNKQSIRDGQSRNEAAQTDNATEMPDKAALLTLFTLSDNKEAIAAEAASPERADANAVAATPAASDESVAAQRVALYRTQHERTRLLYMASANTRPTYLVQTLKSQFVEYQQYLLAQQLDKRGLMDTEALDRLWQQLHIIDDIIDDIVRHMPAQQPAGWQLTTQDGQNPLCFATVGKLKHGKPIQDQGSLNSYVLGHFGVSSFTYDRGYYIGHVIGYLFSCYFCAHLSISYGVRALGQQVITDYDYASLETPHMVRLLQGLDGYCKKRIYQLAVICARLSMFASDKRIERMLIAEVNDFDKKIQQQHLDVLLLQGLMPDSNDSTPFF